MADDWDADAHIDVVSPLVGLTITETQRPGVRQFLEIAKAMADTAAAAGVPGDASLELAPTFTPVDPT